MKATRKSDKLIVRYLLGDLRGQDENRLEESYFENDDFYLQLKKVERDLIDSYLGGTLTSRERQQFEGHYLDSPSRRQRVEFAKALARSFSESRPGAAAATIRESVAWWSSFADLLGPRPRAMVLASALMVVVVSVSLLTIETFRFRNRLDQSERERATLQQRQRDLQQRIAEQQAHSEQLTQEIEQQRSQLDLLDQELARQQQSVPKSQPLIASLVLTPGLVREGGEAKKLVLAGASLVRLQLTLEKDDYRSYRASIRTVEGGEIWNQRVLKAQSTKSGKAVVLRLSAALLTEGDYLLTLSGVTAEGDVEDIGNYYVRVVKR